MGLIDYRMSKAKGKEQKKLFSNTYLKKKLNKNCIINFVVMFCLLFAGLFCLVKLKLII